MIGPLTLITEEEARKQPGWFSKRGEPTAKALNNGYVHSITNGDSRVSIIGRQDWFFSQTDPYSPYAVTWFNHNRSGAVGFRHYTAAMKFFRKKYRELFALQVKMKRIRMSPEDIAKVLAVTAILDK